jgi:hypothetical protein
MTDKSTADILEEAADILETVGWVTGCEAHYLSGSLEHIRGHCATGAIKRAAGLRYDTFVIGDPRRFIHFDYEASVKAMVAVAEALGPDGLAGAGAGAGPSSVIQVWNDHCARDAQEVIDKLKEAAKDLRNAATPEGASR